MDAPKPPALARITDGQVDVLVERLEYFWGKGKLDLSCDQMASVLHCMFPKQYQGNSIQLVHRIKSMRFAGQLSPRYDDDDDEI